MRPAIRRPEMSRTRLHDLRHAYASSIPTAGFFAFEDSRCAQISRFEALVGQG